MQEWLEFRYRQQKLYTHQIKGKALDPSEARAGPIIPGCRADPGPVRKPPVA
jgi:hypothetical protein